MRLRLLIAAVALPLVVWAWLPMPGGAASLSSRIEEKRQEIESQRSREQVLTTDIDGFTSQINTLQADITDLQARESRLQAELDAKLARLSAIQGDLRAERARLARLRARLEESRTQLARRLVDLYKADSPDVLTVVLNSDGFAELIESSEFARRIGRQDQRIITAVTRAKAESEDAAARLADLEEEASRLAADVQDRRDEVAGIKDQLVTRRDQYAAAREKKNSVLASVKGHRESLEGDLAALEEKQAEIQAKLAGVDPGAVGPVRTGSGGLIWPVNGPIVSPFGMRWGRMHEGVDIAVPSGTPVVAAASGTVAISGPVSGYGNYICISHSAGLSTCYGHNTSLAVSVGQSVSQGQVIASSGCTGHCYGPHVHFETRISGAAVDPMGYL
jgi:murein DD-endopeptidase MepM/ murein hydrolase activator NlpD